MVDCVCLLILCQISVALSLALYATPHYMVESSFDSQVGSESCVTSHRGKAMRSTIYHSTSPFEEENYSEREL
jgi:hypothetical protein